MLCHPADHCAGRNTTFRYRKLIATGHVSCLQGCRPSKLHTCCKTCSHRRQPSEIVECGFPQLQRAAFLAAFYGSIMCASVCASILSVFFMSLRPASADSCVMHMHACMPPYCNKLVLDHEQTSLITYIGLCSMSNQVNPLFAHNVLRPGSHLEYIATQLHAHQSSTTC